MPDQFSVALTPRRFFLALFILAVAVFCADWAWYECRVRLPSLGAANGSVHRIRLLAIPAKANKIEYRVDSLTPEEDVPCAHALFPHGGNRPCWYVAKHAADPIPMLGQDYGEATRCRMASPSY
jgi:hypothetical protein